MRLLVHLSLTLGSPLLVAGFVPLLPAVRWSLLKGQPIKAAAEDDDATASAITREDSSPGGSKDTIIDAEITEKKEIVGNLVADDEWAGVTMELSQLVRKSIEEDLKQKTREFLGKEEYELGDVSKEIDARVKQGVADIRGKEDYEVGDLILSMDEMSKSLTEDLTGKPYQPGDLSKELDTRIKGAVASYVGKDEYEAGDLTKAVADKVGNRVAELTANYEFGDISREIERQRKEWVKGFLGEEAAKNYKLGDISKKFATQITGKEDYEFGDVTKKLIGKEDYQFGDVTKSLLGNIFGDKNDKGKKDNK